MKRIENLKALEALETAVRCGSFKAAASELGVSPAAVGQLVRKLEEDLGQSLLLRSANGFQATDATRKACTILGRGFEDVRRGKALLESGSRKQRLYVSVTPSIGERWLTPKLINFLQAHPGIDLRLDSTPYSHYTWSEEFDYAVRYDRPGRSGHEEIPLYHEVLVPVCTQDLAQKIGSTSNPNCLADVPMLHVDRSTDDSDWYHWEDWGRKFNYFIPDKGKGLDFAYTTMVLRALEDGHGLHLAQLSLVLPGLISGELVAPFPKRTWVTPGYPYQLVRLSPGPETKLHRDFSRWVLKEASSLQSEMNAFVANAE